MASTYSPNLQIQLMAPGDQPGNWGNTTNTNLGTLIEQAISGNYTLTVTVAGFKNYVHQNLNVQAASTIREDVALEVGSAAESVTVTAEASMLKTETAEVATNLEFHVVDARDEALAKGVTINALVILTPPGESFRPEHTNPPGGLEKYFQSHQTILTSEKVIKEKPQLLDAAVKAIFAAEDALCLANGDMVITNSGPAIARSAYERRQRALGKMFNRANQEA